MRLTKGILLAAALWSAFGMPAPGFAAGEAPEAPQPPEAAPAETPAVPAYSVARLKINEGTVRVREGDAGDWVEYTSNMPVAEKSRVNVPLKSDAELQFHGEQFVLMTGGTELLVREMNKDRTAFQLASGEIRFDLSSRDDFAPVEVLLPQGGKVRFDAPGRFWVDIGKDGQARLVVRRGEGVVTAAKGEFRVKEGEQASIGADVRIAKYAGPAESVSEPPPLTEAEQDSGVPPSAAYELRDYGDWMYTPDYGYVWRPRVAVGWSPYYYGRWAWVIPWGWTWVAYEPWGWWPYHYGWWWNDPFFGWVWCPFHTFASVRFDFFFGSSRFFCSNVFFRPATVRFVAEGRRVRWTPVRPGDRSFERPPFSRGDTRLTRWDRQIRSGTVFVRERGSGSARWDDWTSVTRQRVSVMPRGIAVGRNGQVLERRDVRPGRSPSVVRPDFGRGDADRRGAPRVQGGPSYRSRGEAPARGFQERGRERTSPPQVERGAPAGRGGEPRGGWNAPRNEGVRPGRSLGEAPAPRGREAVEPPGRIESPPRGDFGGRMESPGRGDFGGRGGGGRDLGGGGRDTGGGRR